MVYRKMTIYVRDLFMQIMRVKHQSHKFVPHKFYRAIRYYA